MSTLSKIFVVINFALAVAFLVFTLTLYSKRVKYYDEWKKGEAAWSQAKTALEATIATKEAENKKLEADKTKAEKERDDNLASAKAYQIQLEQAKKEALDNKATANAALDQNKVLLEQVQKMRTESEENKKAILALNEAKVRLTMDVDEYKKQLVDAQNDINRFKVEIDELHRERQRIAQELADAQFIISDAIKRNLPIGPSVSPVPDVRTKVVDVRQTTGHVALGAGSASGVKEGMIFLINRGDRYIGKVKVTVVWDEFSGGQILPDQRPGDPIKPGDDAMTSNKG